MPRHRRQQVQDQSGRLTLTLALALALALTLTKVLDFTGVQNRPAYLMGVCKRKVDQSDPYPYPYP